MAIINGTNLSAGIVPFTTEDTYPTHYAAYGKGGHRTVQSLVNRDSIPSSLKEEGMTVFVIDNNTRYIWKKNPNNGNVVEWLEDNSGGESVAAGSNAQVMFNDNGTLTGSSDFTYDKTIKKFNAGNTLYHYDYTICLGSKPLSDTLNQRVITINPLVRPSGLFKLNIGFNSGGGGDNSIVLAGANAGAGTRGLAIGNGCVVGSNKLGINNSELGFADNSNHLIEGDFSQRWVKFNGAVLKRVNNITAPASALTTGTVTSYLDGVITDTSKTFTVNAYSDKLIIITGGLGFGNVSKITSNTSNTITCISFGGGLLDSTSTYKIVDATWISNEKFNSEYLIDLSTEDYFIYFNNIPNYSQEINITINKNPNNKNLWVAAEITNGLQILPYKVVYKNYTTPLITHTFKAYQQDVFNRGYLETSNDLNNLLQPIKTSTKDLVIDLYSKIYKIDVATATTVTFNIDSSYTPILTGNSLTIELDVNMTVVSAITWPVNVTWIGGSAPTFGSVAKYRLVFRTENAGTTWLGNLAYTY